MDILLDKDSDLFNFPVDEGRHPGCGQEWWYLQSHLISVNRHFALILCYFISQIKISALVDPQETEAIQLTDGEVAELIVFLESLTSPSVGTLLLRDFPESVPSGLPLAD